MPPLPPGCTWYTQSHAHVQYSCDVTDWGKAVWLHTGGLQVTTDQQKYPCGNTGCSNERKKKKRKAYISKGLI